MREFTKEPSKLHIGYNYLYGYSQPYSVQNGKVVIKVLPPAESRYEDDQPMENEKTTELVVERKHGESDIRA